MQYHMKKKKKDFSDMLEKVDNIIEKIDTTIANTEEIYDE